MRVRHQHVLDDGTHPIGSQRRVEGSMMLPLGALGCVVLCDTAADRRSLLRVCGSDRRVHTPRQFTVLHPPGKKQQQNQREKARQNDGYRDEEPPLSRRRRREEEATTKRLGHTAQPSGRARSLACDPGPELRLLHDAQRSSGHVGRQEDSFPGIPLWPKCVRSRKKEDVSGSLGSRLACDVVTCGLDSLHHGG